MFSFITVLRWNFDATFVLHVLYPFMDLLLGKKPLFHRPYGWVGINEGRGDAERGNGKREACNQ
jgi:hypothetical protein